MNDRNPLIDSEEIEFEDEIEVEEEVPEPPDFKEGDVCVTTEKVKRNYGTIPEGVTVEIKRRFERNKVIHFDVRTLPCKSCKLILKISAVPITALEDYEVNNPSFI